MIGYIISVCVGIIWNYIERPSSRCRRPRPYHFQTRTRADYATTDRHQGVQGPWVALGSSWGSSWGRPWSGTRIWSILGPLLEPKGAPKGTQNRTQNGSKSSTILNIEKVPLQDRLGGVLGRSWSVFGAISESKNLEKPWVFLCFFSTFAFLQKNASQEPSWTELGTNFGAQEAQMGAQEAPKTGPKNDQKKVQNKIWFLRVPGPT